MSMRVRLAGRDPSVLTFGTDSWSSISDPRRFALIPGATGVRTIGGSGGPFCPQPAATTINAEHAKHAEIDSTRRREAAMAGRADRNVNHWAVRAGSHADLLDLPSWPAPQAGRVESLRDLCDLCVVRPPRD